MAMEPVTERDRPDPDLLVRWVGAPGTSRPEMTRVAAQHAELQRDALVNIALFAVLVDPADVAV